MSQSLAALLAKRKQTIEEPTAPVSNADGAPPEGWNQWRDPVPIPGQLTVDPTLHRLVTPTDIPPAQYTSMTHLPPQRESAQEQMAPQQELPQEQQMLAIASQQLQVQEGSQDSVDAINMLQHSQLINLQPQPAESDKLSALETSLPSDSHLTQVNDVQANPEPQVQQPHSDIPQAQLRVEQMLGSSQQSNMAEAIALTNLIDNGVPVMEPMHINMAETLSSTATALETAAQQLELKSPPPPQPPQPPALPLGSGQEHQQQVRPPIGLMTPGLAEQQQQQQPHMQQTDSQVDPNQEYDYDAPPPPPVPQAPPQPPALLQPQAKELHDMDNEPELDNVSVAVFPCAPSAVVGNGGGGGGARPDQIFRTVAVRSKPIGW